MKKLILLSIFSLSLFHAYAQQGGWREKEMEIKVIIQNKDDAATLHALQLNGEIHGDYGLMNVIPSELEKVKSSGLSYELVKDDLNAYYKDFWKKKKENASRLDKYHTYDDIIALMDSLVNAFPTICKKISYGTSVQGRQLCCLKISDQVSMDENEAEVLFDGGIHGDEIGGAENMIRFAKHLCLNYAKDNEITTLVDNREIWIYPMVNPDGRENVTRTNANQIDLNRDFGYMWNGEGSSKAIFSQVETKALRDCMYNNQFVIHLAAHSGSENVFYPWCYKAAHAPDYTNFNKLAGTYSSTSTYSKLVYTQSNADYATTGEVDDCSYGMNGTMGMVLEISTNKQPSEKEMVNYYNYNLPAMIELLKNAGYGIDGVITDSVTGKPITAAVFVDGFYPVYTDPVIGDFHKFLQPGSHSIKVIANGYAPKIISSITFADKKSTSTPIQLQPLKGHAIYKVVSAVVPGLNASDEGNTPAVIGRADNVFYSLGKGGALIIDLQYPITDARGKDLKVIEGDNTPESYTCYAGQTMDGPWKSLGTGTGTTDFDLLTGNLKNAQFIKIVDDNDGTANANDAGFDLDAIEALDNTTTGIEEQDFFSNLIVYPNPFTNTVTLEFTSSSGETVQLNIYNSIGQEVLVNTDKQHVMDKHIWKVDTSNLSTGIYYCRLQTSENKQIVSTCIIKP